MHRCFRFVRHFRFALLLQPVLLELLRVDGLVRALHVLRTLLRVRAPLALRPIAAFALRAITTVSAATAAAAAIAAPPAMFFAFLLRRTLAVLLALRSAGLLLLGRARRTLIGPALALRAVSI